MDASADARRMVTDCSALDANACDLEVELGWLARVIDTRMKLHFRVDCEYRAVTEVTPPILVGSNYADFASGLDFTERAALALALAPHTRPVLLDVFHARDPMLDRPFTDFGGIRGADGGFWPTGETLAFILAGHDLGTRFRVEALFDPRHLFARADVLHARPAGAEEPVLRRALRV